MTPTLVEILWTFHIQRGESEHESEGVSGITYAYGKVCRHHEKVFSTNNAIICRGTDGLTLPSLCNLIAGGTQDWLCSTDRIYNLDTKVTPYTERLLFSTVRDTTREICRVVDIVVWTRSTHLYDVALRTAETHDSLGKILPYHLASRRLSTRLLGYLGRSQLGYVQRMEHMTSWGDRHYLP